MTAGQFVLTVLLILALIVVFGSVALQTYLLRRDIADMRRPRERQP